MYRSIQILTSRNLNEKTKEKHVDQQEETARGKRDVDTLLHDLDAATDRVAKAQHRVDEEEQKVNAMNAEKQEISVRVQKKQVVIDELKVLVKEREDVWTILRCWR